MSRTRVFYCAANKARLFLWDYAVGQCKGKWYNLFVVCSFPPLQYFHMLMLYINFNHNNHFRFVYNT